MIGFKRNSKFLLIAALCLHSVNAQASEWGLGEMPSAQVPQETSNMLGDSFAIGKDICKEHPRIVVSTVALLLCGGAMFQNRHKFPSGQVVVERINQVHGQIELKSIENLFN